MAKITFILGGVRSGKSVYAERLAANGACQARLYIATAEALDEEMKARIAAHRQRRGPGWTTLEEPVAIAGLIASPAHGQSVILVDCLTLWLSNLMERGLDIAQESQSLTHALQHTAAQVVLVSNEVGQGILPGNALARAFCDHAGTLHRQVAEVADCVVWMAAGIPVAIKGDTP